MKKPAKKFTLQESEQMYKLLKDVYETLVDQESQKTTVHKPKLYERIWLVGIKSFMERLGK